MHDEIRKAIERGVNKGEPRLRDQLNAMQNAVYQWADELQAKGARPEEVHLLVSDIIATWHEQGNCDSLSRGLVELYVDEWYEEQASNNT